MCSNEPDQYNAVLVTDLHHQSVLVAANIKDNPAVLEDAGATVYWALISPGFDQVALSASANQAFRAPSASGNLSQNSRRVFLAIILILLYQFPNMMSTKKFPIWELISLD